MRKFILSVTATAAALLVPALVIAAGATASTTTEHFTFADAKASLGPPTWSVIATGDFIAGGTATQKSKGVLTLRFAAGTITFDLGKSHKNLSKNQTATACIQTQTGSGTYTIAGGTGAYQGHQRIGPGDASQHVRRRRRQGQVLKRRRGGSEPDHRKRARLAPVDAAATGATGARPTVKGRAPRRTLRQDGGSAPSPHAVAITDRAPPRLRCSHR